MNIQAPLAEKRTFVLRYFDLSNLTNTNHFSRNIHGVHNIPWGRVIGFCDRLAPNAEVCSDTVYSAIDIGKVDADSDEHCAQAHEGLRVAFSRYQWSPEIKLRVGADIDDLLCSDLYKTVNHVLRTLPGQVHNRHVTIMLASGDGGYVKLLKRLLESYGPALRVHQFGFKNSRHSNWLRTHGVTAHLLDKI